MKKRRLSAKRKFDLWYWKLVKKFGARGALVEMQRELNLLRNLRIDNVNFMMNRILLDKKP